MLLILIAENLCSGVYRLITSESYSVFRAGIEFLTFYVGYISNVLCLQCPSNRHSKLFLKSANQNVVHTISHSFHVESVMLEIPKFVPSEVKSTKQFKAQGITCLLIFSIANHFNSLEALINPSLWRSIPSLVLCDADTMSLDY